MTNESCVHCRMILKEATTTPVLAKEVGFRTEGSMADGSIRTDLSLRRSNATLWQFRMNMIPVDAQRAYSDYSTKSFSKDFEKHQTEYNKWSVAWQGKSLGNARSENNWFPVFVSVSFISYVSGRDTDTRVRSKRLCRTTITKCTSTT